MRNLNRRGLALPFVFVFLVVSHLVYMGLLRLNHLNMRHHQLFQQHYQARVQASMAYSRKIPTKKILAINLKNFVENQMKVHLNNRLDGIEMTWITPTSHEKGILLLQDENQQLLFVFGQTIEFETNDWHELMEMQLLSLDIHDLFPDVPFETYDLLDETTTDYPSEWVPEPITQHVFSFNEGKVTFENNKIKSSLNTGYLYETDTIIQEVPYKIKWRNWIFDVTDSDGFR